MNGKQLETVQVEVNRGHFLAAAACGCETGCPFAEGAHKDADKASGL